MKTKVTNNSGYDKFFGFIPPHGATILDTESVIVEGDLRSVLASGLGRYGRKNELAALNTEEAAGNVEVETLEELISEPVVNSVTPDEGAAAGGTAVVIRGNGFRAGATVDFDGTPATSVVVVDDTKITCVTPAHATGTVDVDVTNTDTQVGTLVDAYTYV